MSEFVAVYDNLLNAGFCQHLIDKFELSSHRARGVTGRGVDVSKKNSTDVTISSHAEWEPEIGQIMNTTLGAMVSYIRRYVFFLTSSFRPRFTHPDSGESVELGPDNIELISDQELAGLVMRFFRFGHINIQKYDAGKGGYFSWHSELGIRKDDINCDLLHRALFFVYYLNDVDVGGETELFYQKEKVAPRTGRLILAPAGFTHTHRGNTPESNDKYILTSWIMYQPASRLFR
jgi:hypothetical protein